MAYKPLSLESGGSPGSSEAGQTRSHPPAAALSASRRAGAGLERAEEKELLFIFPGDSGSLHLLSSVPARGGVGSFWSLLSKPVLLPPLSKVPQPPALRGQHAERAARRRRDPLTPANGGHVGKLQQTHPGGRVAPALRTELLVARRGAGELLSQPVVVPGTAAGPLRRTDPALPRPPHCSSPNAPCAAAGAPARPLRAVAVTADRPLATAPTLPWVALTKRKPFEANKKVI